MGKTSRLDRIPPSAQTRGPRGRFVRQLTDDEQAERAREQLSHIQAYAVADPARKKRLDRERYSRNKTEIRGLLKEKYLHRTEDQKTAQREAGKRYRELNPAAHNEARRRRKAQSRQATPKWANGFFMVECYDLARRRTRATGFAWHIDHVIPLKHPLVCGLHCEQNLAVIPGITNLRKNNLHWPDMP